MTTSAVLYARVSSKDQEREGFSIPAQQLALREYAREHAIAIEHDPQRAPIIAKLFEWYADGGVSLKTVTTRAAAAGLTNRSSRRPLANSKIHQILKNPIYAGDFRWLGHLYQGQHQALISRQL